MIKMCHKCPVALYNFTMKLCSVCSLHTDCRSGLSLRLTEILIKLADALSLPLLCCCCCSDHTPPSALCCLLTNNCNLFFIKLLGLGTIRVWAGGGVCVCARMRIFACRQEEMGVGWVGDTKHCLIFDKQWGLLCAAAVWHIFSRLVCAVLS